MLFLGALATFKALWSPACYRSLPSGSSSLESQRPGEFAHMPLTRPLLI